jgi:hypothetical protein
LIALGWMGAPAARAEAPREPERPAMKVKRGPPPRCVIAPIDLALTPRVSLNRLRSPCARNFFGLALGASRAGELRGVQIGIGANAVDRSAIGGQVALGINAAGEDATGVQLAGLVNAAGDDFTGLQIAGLINAAGEDVAAFQIAGLGNAGGDDVSGMQVGLLFNAAGDEFTGLQASALFNAAGNHLAGIQASALFNAAGGDARGIQASGLFNAAGDDVRGLQLAGLFNAAGGRLAAGQVSGLFNAASELHGLQITGGMNAASRGEGGQVALAYNRAYRDLTGVQIAAVNIGGDVAGAQVGLVNIARQVRGMQLGLVNVADQADAPIGAVSYVRRGERALEVWGGEALALSAGVRLGTRRIYSLAGLSSGPLVDGAPWGPVGGAGVKGAIGRAGVLVDALAHALFFDGVDDQALLLQARARAAYDLSERVALQAGLTWNVFVSGDVDGADLPIGGDTLSRSGDTAVRQWPGFTAGAALRW